MSDSAAAGTQDRSGEPATLPVPPPVRVVPTRPDGWPDWGYRWRRTGQHRCSVQFPERGWRDGRVTISEQIQTARRERRVLARVCRAAWQLEQAGRERAWALASALAEGAPIRTLAGAWLVRKV